jgi:hypothetical protein
VGEFESTRRLRVVEIPIACTLDPDDARSQLGEWQEMLRVVVADTERTAPGRLELRLVPDADMISLIDLAQREVACCPFFSFAVEIHADHLVLAVEVPDDAVEILDQLASGTAA